MSTQETQTNAPRFLDRLHAAVRGETTDLRVAQLIGFTLTAVSDGNATISFKPGPQHSNLAGTLHGGILCDIADAAMGLAYASTLEAGESFTTIELKINFLKPVWDAQLTAEGRIVKRGRTIGLVECDIVDEGGSLVARASSTCMTLRGDSAAGR